MLVDEVPEGWHAHGIAGWSRSKKLESNEKNIEPRKA